MPFIESTIKNMVPDWAVAVARYGKRHRRIPNLFRPKTFNEKILHRMIFDHRSWMTVVADKYRVRDYVREQVGAHLLPDLYCVTTDPDTIPFATLPDQFVVKPTHGSGWVEIVRDKSRLDQARLLQTCRSWLRQNYYEKTREWIYRDVTPRILVEELVDDGSGLAPNDYKLFVFDGRVKLILVIVGRFEVPTHFFLDRSWNPVDAAIAGSWARQPVPPPPHLGQMIEAAEKLARGMDFIRADFYDTENKLFLGELTATPGCALGRFSPPTFDADLGALWKLEPTVWASLRGHPRRTSRIVPGNTTTA